MIGFRPLMRRLALFAACAAMFVVTAYADEITTTTGQVHTVVKGDTLWDIADHYLADPYTWPKLWWYNGQVINPDLIYPGGKIRIPIDLLKPEIQATLEGEEAEGCQGISCEEGIDTAGLAGEEGGPLRLPLGEEFRVVEFDDGNPETVPVKVIEVRLAKGAINPLAVERGGYITKKIRVQGEVLGNHFGKILLAQGDTIFAKLKRKADRSPGARYHVVRPLRYVEHPKGGRNIGDLVVVVGLLKVEKRAGGIFQAKLVRSFDAVLEGDLLVPYVRPNVNISSDNPNRRGYIVALEGELSMAAVDHAVYLDRGHKDGLAVGMEMSVYRMGETLDVEGRIRDYKLPPRKIATIQILSVRDKNATARITYAIEPVLLGDRWVSRRPEVASPEQPPESQGDTGQDNAGEDGKGKQDAAAPDKMAG